MASLARPRANSEMISGSNGSDHSSNNTMSSSSSSSYNLGWIAEAFHRYTLPVNLNQDSVSPDGNGWTHRIQSRFLGVASLKIGSLFLPNMASFYEITESEISEIAPSSSKRSSPPQESSDSNNDPDSCVDALLSLSTAEIFLGRSSPMALPPKKRKRRRVIRYDVVFCLDTPALVDPSPDREYFLFPRDAVVEAVNQTSPFEVLVSYHLPKSSESSTLHSMCLCSCTCNNGYPSKLEEFAAVCSSSDHFSTAATTTTSSSLISSRRSSQRRLTDPGLLLWKPDCHVLNMQLSGVSRDMYIAMKQSVSGFETVCQRTMELMRLHTERLTCEKREEAATIPMALTKTEIQSDEEDVYDKRPLPWSSDEDYEDEDVDDDYRDTDFCMTSPHSKSSSSARDSPPASSSSLSSTTTTTTTANKNTNTTTVPATTPTPTTTTTTTTSSSKRNSNSSSSLKKCLYCGSKSTPMWRRGPQGAGTLCNACGVKWKHGKILCGNDLGPLASSAATATSTAPSSTTAPSTTTSSSRRRSSSNKSSSSNNERKRKTTTKKRSKAKEQRNKQQQQQQQRPPPPSSSSSAIIMAESEDDDLMTGVVHYTATTTPSIPRSIAGAGTVASSWETQHASSLSSYSQSLDDTTFSPLESFSSSPNSSTSMHDSMMLDKYSAGVDAVEAATVLTLLKRS